MAHFPRKPSPDHKPAPSNAEGDLFADAPPAPDSMGELPAENWTLEEAPAVPPKPTILPPANSLSAAGPVRISPISLPAKQASGSPPTPDYQAIPEAVPVQSRVVSASPAPRPVAEAYDPFEIDEDLPAIAPAPPQAVSPISDPSMAGDLPPPPVRSDLQDGIADDFAGGTAAPDRLPANPLKPAGLMAAALVLISLLGSFIAILYLNRPASEFRDARPEPTVPLGGKIATLSAIESGWRSRQPGDLVSTVEVTLPTPSRQTPALLPMVRFTVDAAASKTGFLRFIFFDPDGKISGDVRVVKISGGTIDPLSSGATPAGPGTASVYGSLGFMDRPGFVAYATGDAARWSVEVSESADYNAKQEGWTKLDIFDLGNTTAQ